MKAFLIINFFSYCLLGTIQGYFSFYSFLHDGQSILSETLFSLSMLFASDSMRGYADFISWPDITYCLLIISLPLLLIVWLIRKVKVLWINIAILLYSALTWFLLNTSIFYDREADWSTYSSSEVFCFTWMYSAWWMKFCLAIYAGVLVYVSKKKWL